MSRFFVYIVVSVFYFLFYCNGYKTKSRSKDYKVVVREVRYCVSPMPPYAKTLLIKPMFEIDVHRGLSYIKGNTTIKAPVPFRNFSAQSFQLTGNRREVKFQVMRVSCRNFIAAAILKFTNVSYSKDSCLLTRGFYTYFVDVNKITHSIPCWHDAGVQVHQLQIVSNGVTEMCTEIHVEIVRQP